MVGMGSGLVGLLYLNSPLLFTDYLMYIFSIDLILSAVVFILETKFKDIWRYWKKGLLSGKLLAISGNYLALGGAISAKSAKPQMPEH